MADLIGHNFYIKCTPDFPRLQCLVASFGQWEKPGAPHSKTTQLLNTERTQTAPTWGPTEPPRRSPLTHKCPILTGHQRLNAVKALYLLICDVMNVLEGFLVCPHLVSDMLGSFRIHQRDKKNTLSQFFRQASIDLIHILGKKNLHKIKVGNTSGIVDK